MHISQFKPIFQVLINDGGGESDATDDEEDEDDDLLATMMLTMTIMDDGDPDGDRDGDDMFVRVEACFTTFTFSFFSFVFFTFFVALKHHHALQRLANLRFYSTA